MWEQYAPQPRMRLNLGIRRRLAPLLDNDKQRWRLLHALFLSLPGAPIIYYGDEIGMGDNIWLPDRNGCRTPMQWTAEKNGGFSEADSTYLPLIDDETYGYQTVNVAAQEKDPNSYLALTRFLLQRRQAQAALRAGQMEIVETGNTAVLAYKRYTTNDQLLCLFNLSDKPQPVTLDFPQKMVDLLRHDDHTTADLTRLPPYAAHWLQQKQ